MKSVYILAIAVLPAFSAYSQDHNVKALIISESKIGEAKQVESSRGSDKKKAKKSKKQVREHPAAQTTNSETVALVDEQQYKAKSKFELVLQRRLEIDAAEAKERREAGGNSRRN